MSYAGIVEELSSYLHLDNSSVALSCVETIPPGIQSVDRDVPAACVFWRKIDVVRTLNSKYAVHGVVGYEDQARSVVADMGPTAWKLP